MLERARDAFERGDFTAALALAERSAKLAGSHRNEARLLYGDALFRRFEYARAKAIYVALRKLVVGPQRYALDKRIAAVNRKLGLAHDDGL